VENIYFIFVLRMDFFWAVSLSYFIHSHSPQSHQIATRRPKGAIYLGLLFNSRLIGSITVCLLALVRASLFATTTRAVVFVDIFATIGQLLEMIIRRRLNHVGGTLVTTDIHTNFFFEWIDTEPSHVVEEHKVYAHNAEDPSKDEEDKNELKAQQSKIAAASLPFVEPTDMVVPPKCSHQKFALGEETSSDHAPV